MRTTLITLLGDMLLGVALVGTGVCILGLLSVGYLLVLDVITARRNR